MAEAWGAAGLLPSLVLSTVSGDEEPVRYQVPSAHDSVYVLPGRTNLELVHAVKYAKKDLWFSANLALARTVQVTWVYTELPTAPGRVQPLQSLIQLAL